MLPMNKFSLNKASSNEYYLFYEKKLFNTPKGNKILLPTIKSQTQFIKKVNSEFLKKIQTLCNYYFFQMI